MKSIQPDSEQSSAPHSGIQKEGKVRLTEITERRLAASILIVILSITGVSCTRTPQEKEALFLESGKRHMAAQDYVRAILQFKNATAAMPRDPEPYYQLGLAYLKMGSVREGYAALVKATQLDPKHVKAQVAIAELMSSTRDEEILREAEKRMRDVLSASPDSSDALTILGVTEWQLGKVGEARRHLHEALEKSPLSLKSSVALSGLELEQKDPKEAEQALKQAVKNTPQSPETLAALGEFYGLTGRWTEAEAQFRKALGVAPANERALLGLAVAQHRLGKREQAEKTYVEISALPEKRFKHLYAAYLFLEGKREAATREFERLAKENPSDRDARSRLVEAYLAQNRVSDGEKILSTTLKSNPKDWQALLQRGEVYLRNGKLQEARKDLTEALQYQPTSARAHFLLAAVYKAQGAALRQRQELTQALQLEPGYLAARLELAQNLLAAKAPRTVLELMNGTPGTQKDTIPVIVQRNWALIALRDHVKLSEGVAQGLSMARTPELLIQAATLKFQQRDYEGARALASEALQKDPEETGALEVLAHSYVAEKKQGLALQKVREHVSRRSKSAKLQQFLGMWLLANNGDRNEARAAFEAAIAADPKFTLAYLSLADMHLAEGKLDSARQTLSALGAAGASNSEAQRLLGMVEYRAGNYPAAIERFRQILDENPTDAQALNNLAYFLAQYGNRPDEALKYAQQAKELLPDEAAVEDTIGWVLYHKGLYSTAVQYLERAVVKEDTALRRYHLALAYLKSGKLERGREALNLAERMDPSLPEAQLAREVLGEITGK